MKILLVDDEPLAILTNRQLLARLGYRDILDAEDGETALDIILQERPELVLADIQMSGMSGLDLIAAVRQQGLDTLFIFLSGYNLFQYAQKAITFGAFAYLLKPVDQKELHAVILSAQQKLEQLRSTEQTRRSLQKAQADSRKNDIQTFWADLIFARRTGTAYVHSTAQQLGLQFPHSDFFLGIVQLTESESSAKNDGIGVLLYGMNNIINELLENAGISVTGFYLKSDLCIVGNFDRAKISPTTVEQSLSDAVDKCKEYLHPQLIYGIGFFDCLEQASAGYKVAEQSAAQKLIRAAMGRGNRRFELSSLLPLDAQNRLADYLQSGLIAAYRDTVHRLLDTYNFSKENNWHVFCCLYLYLCIHQQCTVNRYAPVWVEGIFTEDELMREVEGFETVGQSLMRLFARAEKATCLLKSPRDTGGAAGEIMSILHTDLTKAPSQTWIATQLHYTQSYVSRIFSHQIGTSYLKYSTHIRMWEARRLLLSSGDKINRIAVAVGYQDTKYFVSLFKQHTGEQPGNYRKKYGLLP